MVQDAWSEIPAGTRQEQAPSEANHPAYEESQARLGYLGPGITTVHPVLYYARGEMENRIKKRQLYLFADRTSSATMRGNQIRLWFSSLASVIMNELRSVGLQGTHMAKTTSQTIRQKLLKIGARVRLSFRRVSISMAGGYPNQIPLGTILENLQPAYRLQR
jgi:hypothetical protein